MVYRDVYGVKPMKSSRIYDTKVFGGKRFTFFYYRPTKAEAQKDAKRERANGWKVRIWKRKIGNKTYYDLYGRK